MSLVIELGEGFAGDEVVVLVDGQEEWRRADVTTNYSVGLAAVAEVPAEPGATVEVRVRGMAIAERVARTPMRTYIDPGGRLAFTAAEAGPRF